MATTANRNYPKPDPAAFVPENVDEAFLLIKTFAEMVDADVHSLISGLAGKAAAAHGHVIGDITGLAGALAAKMDASATFDLDWLNNVSGTATATDGFVLVKAPGGWTAASALSTLGSHYHVIGDITGLTTALGLKADSSWVTAQINNLINGAPGSLDALNELAAAMGNDPNFATTILNALALKASLAGANFTGPISSVATVSARASSGTTDSALAVTDNTGVEKGRVGYSFGGQWLELYAQGQIANALRHSIADGIWRIAGNEVIHAGNSQARLKTNINASGSAPVYACRAWVNFNGSGTVAIRSSGNVSSITDNGTGDYTVNFTTAMPDANYATVGAAGGGSTNMINVNTNFDPTTSSIRIQTMPQNTGSAADSPRVNVAVFR